MTNDNTDTRTDDRHDDYSTKRRIETTGDLIKRFQAVMFVEEQKDDDFSDDDNGEEEENQDSEKEMDTIKGDDRKVAKPGSHFFLQATLC